MFMFKMISLCVSKNFLELKLTYVFQYGDLKAKFRRYKTNILLQNLNV